MRVLITLALFFTCFVLNAQPPNPGGPPPPNPVPLGGLEILIGAGALLGARKIMQHRKKEQ